MVLRGQCVVRVRVPELRDATDVACVEPWYLRTLLALADRQMVQLFRRGARCVVHLVAIGHSARVDAEIAHVSDMWLGYRLEDLSRERAVLFRVNLDRMVAFCALEGV